MGDVNTRYNPANSVDDFSIFKAPLPQIAPEIGDDVENPIPQAAYDMVAVAGHWEELADEEEHSHVCSALMRSMN